MEKTDDDKFFEKFCIVCYILGFICFLGVVYIYFFGIPNFTDIKAQQKFCSEQGGIPIDPTTDNYNEALCIFTYNDTVVEYVAGEITNEDWANAMGRKVGEYCFHCWDSYSCNSPHGDILREKGVHC
jgi:hypothetical protein